MSKKNNNVLVLVAVLVFALAIYQTYNWFPRPGWKTTSARYVSSPTVEYYVDDHLMQGKLSGGGRVCGTGASRPDCATYRFDVQYNPSKPYVVRVTPTFTTIITSILLFAASIALYRIGQKR